MAGETNLRLRLDHAAVWVADMEKTATFLTDVVGWNGDRAAYFPKDISCGLVIEAYERGPRQTSILHQRDEGWAR